MTRHTPDPRRHADASRETETPPTSETPGGAPAEEPLTKQDYEALARFRFAIRSYLRSSEEIVRSHGVAPQQYQLLLALKGFPGREWATIRELADRLQLRHHSVVELISRAQVQGLVSRSPDPDDGRVVRVSLTGEGDRLLARLATLHRDELRRMDAALTIPSWNGSSGAATPDDGSRT